MKSKFLKCFALVVGLVLSLNMIVLAKSNKNNTYIDYSGYYELLSSNNDSLNNLNLMLNIDDSYNFKFVYFLNDNSMLNLMPHDPTDDLFYNIDKNTIACLIFTGNLENTDKLCPNASARINYIKDDSTIKISSYTSLHSSSFELFNVTYKTIDNSTYVTLWNSDMELNFKKVSKFKNVAQISAKIDETVGKMLNV